MTDRRAREPSWAVTAAIVLVLAGPSAEAQRRPSRALLGYEQVFRVETARDRAGAAVDGVLAALPEIEGWLDGDEYLEERIDPADGQRRLFAVSAADGSARVHRDLAEIQRHLPEGLEARDGLASPDGSRLLFEHSDDLYLYNLSANSFSRLTATPAPERNPAFSPDGRWIAYTREHNLFARDLEQGVERQYTSDGSDVVRNGYASWVYMEEILGRASRYSAFWWSPDGSRLAFLRFDDSPVPVFPIYRADGQHGELERQRYPKAGDPNPWVRMGVVSVADHALVWMDFEERADHYLAWPFWTPDGRTLNVQWMNRAQDTVRFYACDPSTGRKTRFFEQQQSSWVEFFKDVRYLADGSAFLLESNADGWDHLYLHNRDGSLRTRLTAGDWNVTRIELVDEASGYVYFTGRPGRSWDEQFLRVKLDGTGFETLTKGEGVHAVQVAPGGRYFIDTVSTLQAPAVMTLHRMDGTEVRTLGNQRGAEYDEYAWGRAELFTIPSGDGYDLPAYWVLPPDLDPKGTYPVVFSIYGGPNAGRVHNRFPGLSAHYWAQRGVITVSVDHRGSGHLGKKGVALMHRNLGKWEMHDLIAAATWLRTKPFVARDKVAITGGSYGGYVTLMALTLGAGHFNYGQAASSVTDWHLYDTVYTERFMDTPAENAEGYRNAAVLTWIDRYQGGLRITHGTIDDNVHMQNSLQVVDWLTSNDRPFELMLYPDSRHGVSSSQQAHARREAHDFWVRTLLGGRLPPADRSSH